MMAVIEGLTMPGGWAYYQLMPDGSQHRIEADTYSNLLDAVLTFRLQNRIPAGNWVEDVVNQICTKFPHTCHTNHDPYAGVPTKVFPPGPVRFIDQITQWAEAMRNDPRIARLESRHEAERRGDICSNCPFNVEWEHSCEKCVKNAKVILAMIRNAQEISQHRRVAACQILKQDNATAVWLKRELLQRGDLNKLPAPCWVK